MLLFIQEFFRGEESVTEKNKPGVRTISREEFAAIMTLPIREFKFGGVQKRGRYDEESHKFYFINDEGKPSLASPKSAAKASDGT